MAIKESADNGQIIQSEGGGRKRGARNRFHADFIVDLEKQYREKGHKAFDIVFADSPRDYLKICVSVFPKELIVEDGRLESMSDDELTDFLAEIRRLRSVQAGEDRRNANG